MPLSIQPGYNDGNAVLMKPIFQAYLSNFFTFLFFFLEKLAQHNLEIFLIRV